MTADEALELIKDGDYMFSLRRQPENRQKFCLISVI